ncbi:hypothetical protein PR003_g26913 [Phytophthora rubi]|uniref:Uncharacterized protein n=1 Tax=Phytophthora rubi TaxID=129364 RepID=A0A6A3I1T9_9STRA|nr:hypothetical protein PR001_g27154 [Phytophthora rubi]KAE8974018.1 hypothetical protein PR002_g26033 [Phytophthora rubi]KAE9284197.1 hypothetical protein PR003_g26913 [Phytophthora rubi]
MYRSRPSRVNTLRWSLPLSAMAVCLPHSPCAPTTRARHSIPVHLTTHIYPRTRAAQPVSNCTVSSSVSCRVDSTISCAWRLVTSPHRVRPHGIDY